jgi:hypothetical protein
MLFFLRNPSFAQDSLLIQLTDSTFKCLAIAFSPLHPPQNGKQSAHYLFDSTRTALEVNYKNGKQNGLFKSYFPSGVLMEFGVYANGLRNGDWSVYDTTAKLIIKGKYINNIKHGYWSYLKKGCYGRYKNGMEHGTWKCFTDNLMINFVYKRGILRSKKTVYRKVLRGEN